MGSERGDECFGFGLESSDLVAGAADAQERGVSDFAGVGVLAGGFADGVGRCFDVEQVIDDLEDQPETFGEGGDGAELVGFLVRACAEHGASPAGCLDEGAGFVAVDEFGAFEVGEAFGEVAEGVVDLADDHVAGACEEFADEGEAEVGGFVMAETIACIEGEGEHGVSGEEGHGFAGVLVEGGLSSAKVVVVEAWQVVVDEAEGVDEFDGHTDGERGGALGAQGFCASPREDGAEAFAPSEEGVVDRVEECALEPARGGVGAEGVIDRREDAGVVCGRRARGVGVRLRGGHRSDGTLAWIGPYHAAMFASIAEVFRAGGWVMYPLLVLSLLGVTLVVERCIFWLLNMGNAGRFGLYLADLQAGNRAGAVARAREDKGVLARLVRLLGSTKGSPSEGVAVAAVESLRPPIERFGSALGVIIAAAPLLGILGTVTGIIKSFDLLGAATTVSDPVAVAGGIAEALYTTAFGLTIALLMVFPHALFKARAERTLARLEALAGAMVDEGARG